RHSADADIETKVQAEELVLDFHERHGLPITILRPAFIYGPGDARNLPKLLGAIRSGEFRFVGRRDNIVPMVHVSDMAQAMISAAQNPSAAGRIYHITDGSRTRLDELTAYLAELLHVPPPHKRIWYWIGYLGWVFGPVLRWLHLVKEGPID